MDAIAKVGMEGGFCIGTNFSKTMWIPDESLGRGDADLNE